QRSPEARVFVVHRLDKGTSGLLMLARSESVKRTLQDRWREVEKKYFAIVEGRPKPAADVIHTQLRENRGLEVYSTEEGDGDDAITAYRTVKTTKTYALLEVTLQTGRKNQIRVHLAERGHPVAGDRKYGGKPSPARRLALHACSLAFTHPVRGERITLTCPLPAPLEVLLG
ncbi:MAG: RNA pseudouridine synthase, partial [Proteobacteria bacterium]|nr:RNA pseudouridine synthase [Pseudomonadota bacterium]